MVFSFIKHKDKFTFNPGYAYQTSVSIGHWKNVSQFSDFTFSSDKLYWNKEIAAVSYSSNTCLYFHPLISIRNSLQRKKIKVN